MIKITLICYFSSVLTLRSFISNFLRAKCVFLSAKKIIFIFFQKYICLHLYFMIHVHYYFCILHIYITIQCLFWIYLNSSEYVSRVNEENVGNIMPRFERDSFVVDPHRGIADFNYRSALALNKIVINRDLAIACPAFSGRSPLSRDEN